MHRRNDPLPNNDAGISKQNIQERDAHIEKEQVKVNIANIGNDALADNNQAVENAPIGNNQASIPKETHHETRQALDKDSFEDRGASVAKTALEDNLQAAPTDAPIGNNFQPIEQKPLADHFEKLQSDARPLGEPASASPNPITSKPASSVTPVGVKANSTVAANAPSTKANKASPTRTVSPSEAQKIALVHQAQMEAFHGRLKGIKHNVDELNHKLDDLENKS